MLGQPKNTVGVGLGGDQGSTVSASRRRSSIVGRVRAATTVMANPPKRVVTATSTNRAAKWIIKWVKTKSVWVAFVEVMSFSCLAAIALYLLEKGKEEESEALLRGILDRCKQSESGGTTVLAAAIEVLNITSKEARVLHHALGGPIDFCASLYKFEEVEDGPGYNWFNRWGFASSLMFILTTISTIGYGNLYPATGPGRILTMFTAIIGIPLSGFFFHKVAQHFTTYCLWWAHLFHKNFLDHKPRFKSKVKGGEGTRRQSSADNVYSSVSDVRLLIIFCSAAVVFLFSSAYIVELSMEKHWEYDSSVWFVFVTYTTIGLGDYVPSWRESDIMPPTGYLELLMPFAAGVLVILGISFTMAIVQNIGKVFEREIMANLDVGEEGDGGMITGRGGIGVIQEDENVRTFSGFEMSSNPMGHQTGKKFDHGDSRI